MKILLEAPILTKSGYGEHSRLVHEAICLRGDVEVFINPLNWGTTTWDTPSAQVQQGIDNYQRLIQYCGQNKVNPEYDMQVHVGIPNEFEKKASYSVCVTAGIETDRVSPNWLVKTHQGIDKIIVPSNHARAGFVETKYEMLNKANNTQTVVNCNCEVEVVPYPVKELEVEQMDLDLETDFNFLTIAMIGPRKNLDATVRTFIEEFREDENVGLILKTSSARSSIMDRKRTKQQIELFLNNLGPRKCKIYLIHGDLTPEQIHSLYVHPKINAYYTTTHGEGYGLPIFEAVYSEMPVIATDWSAHLDFLSATHKGKKKKLFARIDYDLKQVQPAAIWKDLITEESRWAWVKEASARTQLRKVYSNYGMYKSWAKTLKENVMKTHKKQEVLAKMKKVLFSEHSEDTISEIDKMFASLGGK